MKSCVLIVDDEAAARYGVRRALEREGHDILEAEDVKGAEALIESRRPSVVLLDVKLASESGMDYLSVLMSRAYPPVVIMVTAHGSERLAVEAIKRGAYDYLAKPFDVEELRVQVRNAAETSRLRSEIDSLRGELTGAATFGELVGSSPEMRRVYSLIEKVAETGASVLLTGESGTGKEMVAREIHSRSRVSGGPFVAINCAAMPADLIESELFGHEKGAFTGASSKRIGKFEAASEGTLFLDEIGDMGAATQVKVLRVLDQKTFTRLGGNAAVTTGARIISATNKDLALEVESGRFREDLYYRLCVISIELPPLRSRRSDIAQLTRVFCDRYSRVYRAKPVSVSAEVNRVLLAYDWPGNVRQLRNCLERMVVLADGPEITRELLPAELRSSGGAASKPDGGASEVGVSAGLRLREAKKDFERRYIEDCLERASGNVTRAAQMLGIHRQSLQQKIRDLGLTKRYLSDSGS